MYPSHRATLCFLGFRIPSRRVGCLLQGRGRSRCGPKLPAKPTALTCCLRRAPRMLQILLGWRCGRALSASTACLSSRKSAPPSAETGLRERGPSRRGAAAFGGVCGACHPTTRVKSLRRDGFDCLMGV